ncbi:MAG: HlyD family secretion protein [Pseudoalteromonas rhizosphaerae]|jgi:HlyD family secretion protein|uniref:HlyD family efflux transporter periplasmic adaptor subunit n=1 Tax=Pseudoalteromonas neustonica TaxID=1840331 RepID=A0ABY3F838_9GAMM|nr:MULTISPECIES: HlyD family efflux transporter periplasmic adaptor subunit [Pseudoalteromonas]MBB1294414.1 efflux RND transporter periplasmic adaptor subunit [Pseudoalteromonas sp. SR41-4]MBB1311535.1 efflux RND transporter periplasmic adaptor subunit [Pseudoalteromonas sp. SR41-8]TVU80189.1 HlyD family efflux transporter periplasmic adaptor subunit [Pseudoalteromonas neustonica]|tara:strand:+ start:12002 stop:13255 length:1254 start_codon:yes stop_codon:yes gene_type:complete
MIKDTSGQDVSITQRRSYKKPLIVLALSLAVLALCAQAFMGNNQGSISVERASLQIATVNISRLVRDVAASGKIVAANAPKVYSPERGYVDLQVKAGDKVNKDDIIALVDSPELNNELKQQQSVLARLDGELQRKHLEARRQKLSLTKTLDLAQVELNAADRENRRAKLSIEKNLISQIDLEKAVDDLARAKLSYKHAQQEVELAKDTLAFELKAAERDLARQQLIVDDLNRQVRNLTIKASVTGIVGNLLVQQKEAVTQSQPLMTLVDLSNFEAQLQVPESYANELGLGMEVELTLGAKKVTGVLSAISPEVNNREVTTRVRFDEELKGIRQNQRLTARILLENRDDVLQIKRGAFMQQGGTQVYKVIGDTAQLVNITTGASSINAIELLQGVSSGDQLIISSYDNFKQAPTLLLR